jgi:hypothetical protein
MAHQNDGKYILSPYYYSNTNMLLKSLWDCCSLTMRE